MTQMARSVVAVLFKIIGAVLVVAAGSGIGLYYAGLDHFRAQGLCEIKKALLILASEIDYLGTPLPEAMDNIAKRTAAPASGLFGDFARMLTDGSGETAFRLWEAAAEQNKTRSCLTAEDWDVIISFGKTLGYLDKQMQLNTIRFTTDYIDGKVQQLQSGGDKNKRMYRSLGIIGGALLAVVLW